MKTLICFCLVIYSTFSYSEDIRHLYYDKDKADRSAIYKSILGKDYTNRTTQTEKALQEAFHDVVVFDRINFNITPLPDQVRLYSSEELQFEELISLLSMTYGFEKVFIDISPEVMKKSVKVNTDTNKLADFLTYLEVITETNITIWPKGTGSTIMVSK